MSSRSPPSRKRRAHSASRALLLGRRRAASRVHACRCSGIPEERIRPGVEALCRAIRALRVRERGTGEPLDLSRRGRRSARAHGRCRPSSPGRSTATRSRSSSLPDGSMTGPCRIPHRGPGRGPLVDRRRSLVPPMATNGPTAQVVRFRIALEGERIHWVSPDGRLIDSGILYACQTGTIEKH